MVSWCFLTTNTQSGGLSQVNLARVASIVDSCIDFIIRSKFWDDETLGGVGAPEKEFRMVMLRLGPAFSGVPGCDSSETMGVPSLAATEGTKSSPPGSREGIDGAMRTGESSGGAFALGDSTGDRVDWTNDGEPDLSRSRTSVYERRRSKWRLQLCNGTTSTRAVRISTAMQWGVW